MTSKERNLLLAKDLTEFKGGQAQGQLRKGEDFCCLGRACEVYRLNTGHGVWEGNDFIIKDKFIKNEKVSKDVPPFEVVVWFDWLSINPYLPKLGTTAGEANDRGVSFKEIADGFRYFAEKMFG